MANTSILTSYGELLITNAIATGTMINLPTFVISSSNSFDLTQDLDMLPDVVYTSSDPSVFSIVKVASNTVEFRVYLNTSIGDFDIGAIGILDNTGKLVAAGQLDIVSKRMTTNDQEGNTLQFKLPVNIANASQLVTSISQEFHVDGKTILINSEGVISSGVVPHHVFDIFQNASTSNPPGALPMWTGETVYCSGAHEEFYAKAVEYASNNYIRSITSSVYDAEVAAKGWTNGFVITSSNKSIRLPKFKGVLYLNDPSVSTTTAATSKESDPSYGFITLPTYIQIDTAAVPATVAQCNAFSEALEDFATQFVTLQTVQTVSANKTWSGIQTFNGDTVFATGKTLTNNGTSALKGTNNLSGTTNISGTLSVTSNGSFTGSSYTANGTWTFGSLIMGTAYAAQYRDLAEYYRADKVYPAGTLIEFGGDNEITSATVIVNGVISTEAGIYLGHKKSELDLPVAMTGKVPVRVKGKIHKFELIANNFDGTATAYKPDFHKSEDIIGRSLESNMNEDEKLVLCVTHMKLY